MGTGGKPEVGRAVALAAAALALAAAAFAGVDGWDRAKAVPRATGDEPLTAFGGDMNDLWGRNALMWRAEWGNKDLNYILVQYADWRFCCIETTAEVDAGSERAGKLKKEAEAKRSSYKNDIRFRVTIAAGDIPISRINNAACWTIYLIAGDEAVMPTAFEHIEESDTTTRRRITYFGTAVVDDYSYVTKTYDVIFPNPYGGTPPDSLKLCIEGEYARRGFEWKFENKK